MSEVLRSGVRVPKPRVSVQQIGGAWVVLVDGIEESEHKSKTLAQAAAKVVREGMRS